MLECIQNLSHSMVHNLHPKITLIIAKPKKLNDQKYINKYREAAKSHRIIINKCKTAEGIILESLKSIGQF